MATITRAYLIDDLDKSEEDAENVLLGLDGMNYEIDLSAANAGRLREKLARFIDAATAVKASKSARPRLGAGVTQDPASADRDQVQAVRAWASAAGYEVSSRGRVPKAIQEAFAAAH